MASSNRNSVAEFDQFAQSYLKNLDHPIRRLVSSNDDDYFIELKCEEIYRIVEDLRLPAQAMQVTDVGAGIGLFEKYLYGTFHRLWATDFSIESLKVAQHLTPLQNKGVYVGSNAVSLPFPDDSMDIVISSCLFHHLEIEDQPSVLREMHRVCKPGGYLIIFEHNPFNPITQLVVRTTPLDFGVKLIRSRVLTHQIRNASFQIVDKRYIVFGPRFIDKILDLFRSVVRRLPLGGQYYVLARKD